jgi:hypothetical protein
MAQRSNIRMLCHFSYRLGGLLPRPFPEGIFGFLLGPFAGDVIVFISFLWVGLLNARHSIDMMLESNYKNVPFHGKPRWQ